MVECEQPGCTTVGAGEREHAMRLGGWTIDGEGRLTCLAHSETKPPKVDHDSYVRGVVAGRVEARAAVVASIRSRADAQRSKTYRETLNDVARRIEDGRL